MSNPTLDLIQKAIATLREAEGTAVNPNPDPTDPTDPDPGTGGGGTGYTLTRGFSLRPTALTGTVATAGRYLFSITDLALRTTGNGGVVTSASGHDIRIEDGASTVPYRRVSYNATTGTLIGWVRIPSGVGPDGVVLTLKAGKSGDTDQADPAGTFATYGYAYGNDGTDYSGNSRDLVLGTGVTAGTGDKIVFDGQGGVATYTGDLSFLRQTTIGMYAHIAADASYYGSDRGFMINLGEGPDASFLWRNNQAFGGVTNVFRAGGWRQGAWGEAAMPATSAIGGDPVGVCVNYLPSTNPQIGIAGEFPTPSSSTPHASSGTMDTFGSVLTFGKGSTEGAGVSLLGSMGPLHARPWAYGEAEKLLLDRQIAGWNAIQMADADGNYVALATPPVLSNGPAPSPPIANDDSASTAFQTLVNITVLANDVAGTDPIAPATVAIVDAAAKGSAAAQANGTINYTPGTGETGIDSFTYRVNDTEGRSSNAALVTVSIGEDGGGTTPPPGGTGTPLPPVTGQTRNVSNQTEFNAALSAAAPGDHIVLANGSYTGPGTWTKSGSSNAPIVLRSANLLGARITGSIDPNGSDLIFYGLDLPNSFVRVGQFTQSNRVRVWRCRWRDRPSGTSIGIRTDQCDGLDIAYCEWVNWAGRGISTGIANGTRNYTVRRCLFRDAPNQRKPDGTQENATEALQLGFANGDARINSGGRIEYNRFVNWNSDDEVISTKTSGTLFLRNTVENCQGSVSNRSGDNNRYEAFSIIGSGGFWNWSGPNWYLGNSLSSGHPQFTGQCRLFTGTTEGGIYPLPHESSHGAASMDVHLAGNSFAAGLLIGYNPSWAGSVSVKRTRVRQHTGSISLGNQENTDSQPGTNETLYSWLSPAYLANGDVGPLADL